MMIHFSGLRNIDKPGILAFPKVLVCLECGFSQFTISNTQLALLASPTATGERQPFLRTESGMSHFALAMTR
jgi:hypothetical protein